MTLREALVTLIEFARDQGAESDPRMKRAIKRVGEKADRLRQQHEARSQRHPCHWCENPCDGLLCWNCWNKTPEVLRTAFTGARTGDEKRAATRRLFEYIREQRTAQIEASVTADADLPPEAAEALGQMIYYAHQAAKDGAFQ